MIRCYIHNDRTANNLCMKCNQWICNECSVKTSTGIYCTRCSDKTSSNNKEVKPSIEDAINQHNQSIKNFIVHEFKAFSTF